jgi:hypothetical protein
MEPSFAIGIGVVAGVLAQAGFGEQVDRVSVSSRELQGNAH